jgi:hypothetical protein
MEKLLTCQIGVTEFFTKNGKGDHYPNVNHGASQSNSFSGDFQIFELSNNTFTN